MVNYIKGEQLYREFVRFRDEFIASAVARAQHVDESSDGRSVRPIVVVPFTETARIQAEIDKWTLMAKELEQYPDLNIPKTILYPIPNILRGVRKATIYQTEVINSMNMTAKRIIHLIDKDVRIQQSGDANERSKRYIENLMKTRNVMEGFPADEKFRMRVHGFTETSMRVHYISTSPNYNSGKSVFYHVPLCGVFICDETLRDGLSIGAESQKEKYSLYDRIDPIICDRWPQAKIYRIKDIEAVKNRLAQEREAEKIKSAASSTRTRKTKKGRPVNDNPESAK